MGVAQHHATLEADERRHVAGRLHDAVRRGFAQQIGLLYVVEGSRLGGRLLLQRVRPGFSSHYLSAIHEPGEWRTFTMGLDDLAKGEGADWLEGAVAGAVEAFQLYEAAAEAASSPDTSLPGSLGGA